MVDMLGPIGGCPSDQNPTILVSTLSLLIFGNSHVSTLVGLLGGPSIRDAPNNATPRGRLLSVAKMRSTGSCWGCASDIDPESSDVSRRVLVYALRQP